MIPTNILKHILLINNDRTKIKLRNFYKNDPNSRERMKDNSLQNYIQK